MPTCYQNVSMLVPLPSKRKIIFSPHINQNSVTPLPSLMTKNLVVSHVIIIHTVAKLMPERKWISENCKYLPIAEDCLVLFPTEGKCERLCDSSFIKYNLLILSPSISRESIWTHLIEQDAPVCAGWYCMVSFSSTLFIIWQISIQSMFSKYVKHMSSHFTIIRKGKARTKNILNGYIQLQ